jgi:sugar lactone lactonase YvrE
VDSSGTIYVSDSSGSSTSGIEKFNSSGTYLGRIGGSGSGTGQLKNPRGIVVDSAGNVWACDTGDNRIVEFDSNGNLLTQFGSYGSGNGYVNSPWDVTLDSSGNVWVVDAGNNRIEEFSSAGVFLTQFGSSGSGNGQFNGSPTGVAVDSVGNVWVADGTRLQEFAPVPEPSTMVLLGVGAVSVLAYGWRRRTNIKEQ